MVRVTPLEILHNKSNEKNGYMATAMAFGHDEFHHLA
jgi:hypothetical protein